MDSRLFPSSRLVLWHLAAFACLAALVLGRATPSPHGLVHARDQYHGRDHGLESRSTPISNWESDLQLDMNVQLPRSADAANLTRLPPCAYKCITTSCPDSDLECFCDSQSAKETIERCTVDACVLYQSIHTRYAMETVCQTRVRSRVTNFIIMDVIAGCVTGTLVFARVIFKRFFFGARRLALDDTLILIIIIIGIPCIAIMVFGPALHGLGKDIWGLQPKDIVEYGQYFFAAEIIYVTLMSLVKVSLCLFYVSIFSVGRVSYLLWGTVIFHVLFGVAFLFKLFFQCTPLSFYWEQLNFLHPATGHCINLNDSTWANAAINVASDIWLLAIPLSQVTKLNLHWKKKVAAAIMFTTGAGATVISVLRLHSIVDFNKTTNPTWEQYSLVWWSTLEINVGITVTCLPSLRLILLRLWPATFGGGSGSTDVTGQENSAPGQLPTIGSADSTTRRGSEGHGPQHQVYHDANNPHNSKVSLYKKADNSAPSIEGTGSESCSRTSTSRERERERSPASERKLDLKQVICIELGERTERGKK